MLISLVENKPVLATQDVFRRPTSKVQGARTVKTRVPCVYLKMMAKMQQNMANSFSEGMFQLSLTSIYTR